MRSLKIQGLEFEANTKSEDIAVSTVWKSQVIGLRINELSFSSCGMNLVITLVDDPRPVVRPIQSAILLREPPKLEWPINACTSLAANSSVTVMPYRSRSVLRSGAAEIQDDGSGKPSTILMNDKRNIEITRSSQPAEGPADLNENVLSISALPDWPNIEKTKLALAWPASKEEKIKIVLNQAAQSWYSLSDAAEKNLPSLIHRDQRTVKPSIRYTDSAYHLVNMGYDHDTVNLSVNHAILREQLADSTFAGLSPNPDRVENVTAQILSRVQAINHGRFNAPRKRNLDSIKPDVDVSFGKRARVLTEAELAPHPIEPLPSFQLPSSTA